MLTHHLHRSWNFCGCSGAFSTTREDTEHAAWPPDPVMHRLRFVTPKRLSCLLTSARYLQRFREKNEPRTGHRVPFQRRDGRGKVPRRADASWSPTPLPLQLHDGQRSQPTEAGGFRYCGVPPIRIISDYDKEPLGPLIDFHHHLTLPRLCGSSLMQQYVWSGRGYGDL